MFLLSKSISMYIFLILILIPFTSCTASTKPNPQETLTDRRSLLDIRSCILQDPHGLLSPWNDSSRHCTWPGIRCNRHARVKSLDLSSMGMIGSLSPAIGNLSFLLEISLYNNTFSGLIPQEVSKLPRLRTLDLSSNFFSGEIPSNLSHCTQLVELFLGKNKLVGSIPADLHSMFQLQTLSLHDNSLRGDLWFLGNLTFLEVIYLDFNSFEGRIPDTIGGLKGLSELGLGANRFVGAIPLSIFNISSLTALSLGASSIEGTLPKDIGFTLPLLETLIIRDCLLSGTIPASLSNLSNIQQITLANNSLTGKILISGKTLPNIQWLELDLNLLGLGDSNDLDFLHSFTNNSQLQGLNVYNNQLAGFLPQLPNLSTSIQHLVLSTNLISGEMGSFLSNLINLQVLDLSSNMFTGKIPSNIGMLSSLGTVYFSSNKLSGNIPTSIGNLSQLTNLLLDDNNLQGLIPSSLGNCSGLQFLNLSKNHFSGNIPLHLFYASSLSVALDLSSNKLQGNLPAEIGSLKSLALLDVSKNRLSGEIPVSLGQCRSLTELYMESNLFFGSIPSSLSSLAGLISLDLSQNKLSGQIPVFMSGLTLLSLNLSFNNLEGQAPVHGIFANVSGVSLVGNKELCDGIKALHLPKCNGRSSSRGSRRRLAAILAASISCLLIIAIVAIILVWIYVDKKKQNIFQEDSLGNSFERVSYNILVKATDEFTPRNLIGMGGFGSVYSGVLDTKGKKMPVAVKVLNLQHQRGGKSFMRECNALRNIRHRNLVKIISACSSIDSQRNDFKALVYELLPNGSLDKWLHTSQNLSLLQRLNIITDVACALDYLHNECEAQVIHCDLKPSNILLDDNMVAHVGDFGLARLLPDLANHSFSNTSLGVKGTIGYAAPEYGLGNQVSTSGDVYSFGIVLLEMITGKTPSDQMFKSGLCLHGYAKNANLENLVSIIDHSLMEVDHETGEKFIDEDIVDCLLSAIKIGVECSLELPTERICIRDAIQHLKLTRNILLGTEAKIVRFQILRRVNIPLRNLERDQCRQEAKVVPILGDEEKRALYDQTGFVDDDHWVKPAFEWTKLNTDGCSKGNPGPGSRGGLLRDSNGEIIRMFAFQCGVCNSLTAELWAICRGLELAHRLGVARLLVESDSETAVNAINNRQLQTHPDFFLIEECRRLLHLPTLGEKVSQQGC